MKHPLIYCQGWLLNHICRTLICFQSSSGQELAKRVLVNLCRLTNLCLQPALPEAVLNSTLKHSLSKLTLEMWSVGICAWWILCPVWRREEKSNLKSVSLLPASVNLAALWFCIFWVLWFPCSVFALQYRQPKLAETQNGTQFTASEEDA